MLHTAQVMNVPADQAKGIVDGLRKKGISISGGYGKRVKLQARACLYLGNKPTDAQNIIIACISFFIHETLYLFILL